MNIKSLSVLLILFTALLFLNTCSKENPAGSDNDPLDQTDPDLVSAEIGLAGGSITSKDGRVTLDFPEGALSSTETITITPIEQDDLGPEFDEVLNEFNFGKAYEMGPDGLSFEEPVTVMFQSEQVVTQQGDSVSISPELLFTNEGNGTVALDSLRMSVDEESGEVTVIGELNHFSRLEISDKSSYVTFIVKDVPDYLYVRDSFTLYAKISSGSTLRYAIFNDLSSSPLMRKFDPARQSLPHIADDITRSYLEYGCMAAGEGLFKSEGSGYVSLISGNIKYRVYINGLIVEKDVKCEPPPQLISPADKATNVELETTLNWKAVEGAELYIVQLVEEGKEFNDEEAAELDAGNNLSVKASNLKSGITYKWRVGVIASTNTSSENSYNYLRNEERYWSEKWTFTTKGSAEAKLDLQKQCVEHPDASRIANLFGFSIENNATKSKGIDFLKDDITEYTVTKSIELPDGTTEEVSASPNSEGQLLLELEIYVYGNYAWEITDVTYQEESVPFSGDISGEIEVTSDEQDPGECTL